MKSTAASRLRQIPQGYLVIGVDPHKKTHAAVVITQDFTTHAKFKFSNTMDGLEMMLQRTKAEMIKTGCRGVIFAIETGGHYWRNLAYILDERGIPFHFINQFTLKRRREGKDINKRKNDYRDSEVAAQLLCTGEFTESKLPQGVYAELRAAHNAYRRLVKERTRITNLTKGLFLPLLRPVLIKPVEGIIGSYVLEIKSMSPNLISDRSCSISSNLFNFVNILISSSIGFRLLIDFCK
jgi:transposase